MFHDVGRDRQLDEWWVEANLSLEEMEVSGPQKQELTRATGSGSAFAVCLWNLR
jgi:hypothetical protein